MTNEEALNYFKLILISNKDNDKSDEYYRKAIAAIKKQIPRKVDRVIRICRELAGHCPSCFKGVNEEMGYCDSCGQALDWS